MPQRRVLRPLVGFLVGVAAFMGTPAFAQNAQEAQDADHERINEQLDTIIANQRIMLERAASDPLAGRHFGVEVNPVRALVYSDLPSLSGTVSIFSEALHAEIAFPLFYGRSEDGSDKLTAALVDMHFRYFLRAVRNGFYISAFTRYAHLKGTLRPDSRDGSEDKVGVGFGIGIRVFSRRGPYWGTSLSLGRYVVGESRVFEVDDYGDDFEYIFDVELLKFGWAF